MYTGFWWGKLRERDHLEEPGIDERIILRWILSRWDGGHGLAWSGSLLGQVASSCEPNDEPSGNFLTS